MISSISLERSCAAARLVHSLVSLERTSIIASTPCAIPPSKSPVLKRGVTAVARITLETAFREHALQSVTDLDSHFPFIGRDQKQNPVVFLGDTELPRAEKPVGVTFDV